MIFTRSKPPRQYADYTRYRPYLRKDFQHRCAYCLRHEGHNGGEANFGVDHHWPIRGPHGRPELECEYTNLYYACAECNENKADTWPDDEYIKQGYRFLDPCQPEGDHDLHWHVNPDGSLDALTNIGEYTIRVLVLWRPLLQDWRARIYQLQQRANDIENNLLPKLSPAERQPLEASLREIRREIEPPVFDRPHGEERRRRNVSSSNSGLA